LPPVRPESSPQNHQGQPAPENGPDDRRQRNHLRHQHRIGDRAVATGGQSHESLQIKQSSYDALNAQKHRRQFCRPRRQPQRRSQQSGGNHHAPSEAESIPHQQQIQQRDHAAGQTQNRSCRSGPMCQCQHPGAIGRCAQIARHHDQYSPPSCRQRVTRRIRQHNDSLRCATGQHRHEGMAAFMDQCHKEAQRVQNNRSKGDIPETDDECTRQQQRFHRTVRKRRGRG